MACLPLAARRRLRRLVGHTTSPPSPTSSSCRPKQGCCCAAAADAAAPQAVALGHPCFVGEPEVAAFRRNGFHVLPAMLSPAEIERAAALFESVVAQGGGLRNLLDREEGLLFVAAHPTLLAAVHAILSPRPQILQYDGIDQLPGSSDQTYHADFSFFSSGVTLMLNVGVYLDGLNEANGPIWVVPGSHDQPPHGRASARDGVFPLPPPDRRTHGIEGAEPVHCPPGSAVLFDCCTWHHGGGNRIDSGQRRRAVFPTYGHWWMKRFESWMPLPQRERWPNATEEELELLGVELRGESEYGGYQDGNNVRKDMKGEWME